MARLPKKLDVLSRFAIRSLVALSIPCLLRVPAMAQENEFTRFDATSIFQELDTQSSAAQVQLVRPWWDEHVTHACLLYTSDAADE